MAMKIGDEELLKIVRDNTEFYPFNTNSNTFIKDGVTFVEKKVLIPTYESALLNDQYVRIGNEQFLRYFIGCKVAVSAGSPVYDYIQNYWDTHNTTTETTSSQIIGTVTKQFFGGQTAGSNTAIIGQGMTSTDVSDNRIFVQLDNDGPIYSIADCSVLSTPGGGITLIVSMFALCLVFLHLERRLGYGDY